jgi:nitronate monooxygenase
VAAVAQANGFGPLGMVREPEALIRSEVEARRGGGIERFGVNLTPAATVGQHKNRNLKNLI